MDISTIEFIKRHINDDPTKLRLKYHGDKEAMDAVLQLECRRKNAAKLNLTLSNENFMFPTGLSAEQCTSDELAAFHASLIAPGSNVIDMTCGLGIDTFHIARHGCHVTALEKENVVAVCARHNVETLGLEKHVEIINADSASWLEEWDGHTDVVFIDPARRGEGGRRLFGLSDCSPDVLSLLPLLRSRCDRSIVKASPMLDISALAASLAPHLTDIYITGSQRECKELVAVSDFRTETRSEVKIHVVIGDRESFSFTPAEEKASSITESMPAPGNIIHEPWAVTMKSGAFRILASRYGLDVISHDTHLYHAETENSDFPGRRYTVMEILPFNRQGIKKAVSIAGGQAEVSARNFGMKAEQLAEKLRIRQSGPSRIWGVRDTMSDRYIIIGHRNDA